jgi:hypothetical protein
MEEPLFRVISQAAEQRIALKLRSGATVDPRLLASQLLDEFSQFLQFDDHREALQTRLESHISKFFARHNKSRT